MKHVICIAAVLAAALLSACQSAAPPSPAPPRAAAQVATDGRLTLAPAQFAELPGWTADNQAEALVALRRSCARILRGGDERLLSSRAAVETRAGSWRDACNALPPADGDARGYFERYFQPFAVSGGNGSEGLFTGYYEPELAVSRRRGGRYQTPVRALPPGGTSLTRAQIESGRLRRGSVELAWVADPVDKFFLQIQGSGMLRYPDGTIERVGYAGQNGHRYVAIGAVLANDGEIPREEVTMQSIRAWLAANPRRARAVLNSNPSYVFFRRVAEGPVGAERTVLTPGRSLAVDTSLIPLGLPVWLDADDPLDSTARVQRLMVAQDTGGAIRGAVRGDVFWGAGPEAAERAGRMRSTGRYWVLLPAN
jgi:membrane-bound lytic murein transglycosylase A